MDQVSQSVEVEAELTRTDEFIAQADGANPSPKQIVQDDDATVAADPPPNPSGLTREEVLDLAVQETVIGKGLGTFRTVGEALERIRVLRLYRLGHATFDSYVHSKWDMTKQRAHQLIDAASVAKELSTNVDILPVTESQVRPLTKLNPAQRQEVWNAVVERVNAGESLTAKLVTEVRDELLPAEAIEPEPPVNAIIDESFEGGYLFGNWVETLTTMTVEQIGLVLIPVLVGDTPEAEAESLSQLLDGLDAKSWTNYHVLVLTKFDDYRKLVNTGEDKSLAFGGTIVWSSKKVRTIHDWSIRSSKQHILHFRRGETTLANPCADVLECESDPGYSGPPVAIVREVIDGAINAGGVVLVAPGGNAAASMVCAESGRHCIEVESDAKDYARAKERLDKYAEEVQEPEIEEVEDVEIEDDQDAEIEDAQDDEIEEVQDAEIEEDLDIEIEEDQDPENGGAL